MRPDVVLAAAVVLMGLLAGLFYAFDVAVMPALAAADDRTRVEAMRQMIDKIENPGFYLTLLGAPALGGVALAQARRTGAAEAARWIVAGLGFYAVMVVVTVAVHFPLNAEVQDTGDPGFVGRWVAWNVVRTLATTAAVASLTWALVVRARTS